MRLMQATPNAIATLPKWAQHHIEVLTRQRDDARKALQSVGEPSDCFIGMRALKGRPNWWAPNGERYSFWAKHDDPDAHTTERIAVNAGSERGTIDVRTAERLLVLPSSNNSVVIKAVPF